MRIIKVASNSRTSGVAGAIAHSIRENGYTQVQGIGAGAVNQMVKATIVARDYLAEEGTTINFTADFKDVLIGGEERTALCLTITSSLLNEEEARRIPTATEEIPVPL